MGKVRTGKWFVHSDDLCLDLPEPDGGCFEVTRGNEAVKGGTHDSQEVTTHFCCRLRSEGATRVGYDLVTNTLYVANARGASVRLF